MPAFVKITYKDKEMDLASWGRHLNIPYKVLYKRYEQFKKHGDVNKLFRKYKPNRYDGQAEKLGDASVVVEYRGVKKSLREWCAELGLEYQTVRMRYRRGVMGAELFREVRPYVAV